MTIRHIVLTGQPGVGKTTLIQYTVEKLKAIQIPVNGFYTSEVRVGNKRVGFDIVTLDGKVSQLARVFEHGGDALQRLRAPTVGQFFVNLPDFERLALPLLQEPVYRNIVFVLDEVGKMELFSREFEKLTSTAFNDKESIILATIPIPKSKPLSLVDQIRARPDVKIYEVTHKNRNEILNSIVDDLKVCWDQKNGK